MQAPNSKNLETAVQLSLIQNQGLYLIWQARSDQSTVEESTVQSYLLSPWVTAMKYGYYESETDTWDYVSRIPESKLAPLSPSKKLYCLLLAFENPQTLKTLSLPIYLSSQAATAL